MVSNCAVLDIESGACLLVAVCIVMVSDMVAVTSSMGAGAGSLG